MADGAKINVGTPPWGGCFGTRQGLPTTPSWCRPANGGGAGATGQRHRRGGHRRQEHARASGAAEVALATWSGRRRRGGPLPGGGQRLRGRGPASAALVGSPSSPTTSASIGAGADVGTTGDLGVAASQDTGIDLLVSGAGGASPASAGPSRSASSAKDGPTWKGRKAADAAVLNASGTRLSARRRRDITTAAVSARRPGIAGVAGAPSASRWSPRRRKPSSAKNTQVN